MFRALTLSLAGLSALAVSVPTVVSAQSRMDQQRMDDAQRRYDNETALYNRARADYDRSVRRYPRGGGGYRSGYNDSGYRGQDDSRYATTYDASRDYRDDSRYQERTLSSNDQVYRGSDGRYYCKRNDGTTGLIIGGIGGAVAGNVIDGGRNRVAGTLIGGALGAIIGKKVDQGSGDQVRCR